LGVTRERSSLTALDDGAKTMTSFPERASIARTASAAKVVLPALAAVNGEESG